MVMMVQRLMKYEMTMDDGDDGTTINEIWEMTVCDGDDGTTINEIC
jgi:hypothetical protein